MESQQHVEDWMEMAGARNKKKSIESNVTGECDVINLS